MTNEQLIQQAAALVRPHVVKDRLMADVGAVVISEQGKVYMGVCADTAGTGVDAEVAVLMAMITAGEYKFQKIVAVWKDTDGTICVLHPCGKCREFMRQIDLENMEAEVILGKDRTARLKELLPYQDDFSPVN